jgi:hypothetical protein
VCTGGQVCTSSHCGCAFPTISCQGGCVDAAVYRDNCGSCNNACATGLVCIGGLCVTPAPPDAGPGRLSE